MISISDAKTNELYGNYVPNGTTGRYIMILPPGKYHVSVQHESFTEYKQDINIEDKGSFQNRNKSGHGTYPMYLNKNRYFTTK